MQYTEENNYPKAVMFSAVLMGLFLLISYLIIISMPPPDVGTGGVVVNYGTSEEGMGTDYMSIDEPSVNMNANNASPDKVVPDVDPAETPSAETSNEDVITQNNEDAPSIATKDKKSVTPSTTVPKESKPTINPNALYKGKSTSNTGQGDGTGSTPGNQGSVNGDPFSPDYGAGGSGFGSVNLTLEGRQFLRKPEIKDDGQRPGKIAVEIMVDKNGEVVYARAGVRGTTISDLKLQEKCRLAVLGARLNKLESAPDVQRGVIVFNFKND